MSNTSVRISRGGPWKINRDSTGAEATTTIGHRLDSLNSVKTSCCEHGASRSDPTIARQMTLHRFPVVEDCASRNAALITASIVTALHHRIFERHLLNGLGHCDQFAYWRPESVNFPYRDRRCAFRTLSVGSPYRKSTRCGLCVYIIDCPHPSPVCDHLTQCCLAQRQNLRAAGGDRAPCYGRP